MRPVRRRAGRGARRRGCLGGGVVALQQVRVSVVEAAAALGRTRFPAAGGAGSTRILAVRPPPVPTVASEVGGDRRGGIGGSRRRAWQGRRGPDLGLI
jgi:hypothetical protein